MDGKKSWLKIYSFTLLIAVGMICHPIQAQLVINEILSSNISGITDEDGDYSDWIELRNVSDVNISLSDFYLSDDHTDSTKWQFPAINLKKDAYQLVFASGKDRKQIIVGWNTLINKGDEWHYLVPSSAVDHNWKQLDFDDSGWLIGNSGFGYGDDDDATVITDALSVYIRRKFTIDDINEIVQMVLHLDYDDGFVAYINGVELARDRLGPAGSLVSFDQTADDYNHEALMYQGLQPNLFEIHNWKDIVQQGDNILAIQVHNFSSTSSDLTCIPYLSVGLQNGDTFYPSPDINLPSAFLHSNFKIKAGGEALYLYKNKELVDSVGRTELYADISYGRSSLQSDEWVYFDSPTPESKNGSEGVNELLTDSVIFSSPGGWYAGSQQIYLSIDGEASGDIYYTTDGSVPTKEHFLYETPIAIDDVTVLKARAFVAGKLVGPIGTNTYLIGKNHDVPVVSLSTNPDNFFDYQTGIYEMGPNANPEIPHFGANFWQDWERPVNFEYFDKNGIRQINQGAGVKIFGAWSRAHPQKSLALFARKEYGDGSFSYQFFDKKSNEKYEALVLRNSGNAFYGSHLHDAFMTDLMSQSDIELQAFQPTVVYINGAYWGIMNMREKVNEHFIADNTHVDANEVNILEGDAEVVEGTNVKYQELLSFVKSNSLASADHYNEVVSDIDIDNYIKYQLIQTYIDNRDWPGNNIKYWNTNSIRSKYRWILYDTDFGFGLYGYDNYKYNSLNDALATNGPDWPNPPWSTLLFRKLIANPNFKKAMALKANDFLNTTWKPAYVEHVVDSIKKLYVSEMNGHCERWGLNYNNWSGEVERLKTFGNNRPWYYRNYLMSVLGYQSTNTIIVDTSNENMGKVMVNSIYPDAYPFTGDYFTGLEITLKAIPKPGYKFDKWRGDSASDKATLKYIVNGYSNFEAQFTTADEEDVNIIINEVFYKSSENIKPSDWIELYNAGSTAVDLRDWMLSDGQNDSAFVLSNSYILNPDAYLVICKNKENFKTTYPWVKTVVGEIRFGLSRLGDNLRLYNPSGQLVDAVDYYPNGDWPVEANGKGASIEVKDPLKNNELADNWEASFNGGTPGERNANYVEVGILERPMHLNASLSCVPNPVSTQSVVSFSIKNAGLYQFKLFDLSGKEVSPVLNEIYSQGNYQILFSQLINHQKAGMYVLQLSGHAGVESIKIVILP